VFLCTKNLKLEDMETSLESRRLRLADHMLSPAVQVQMPQQCKAIEALLSEAQVKKVFTDHVRGVHSFLFRDKPGHKSLTFMVGAYREGLRAFRGSDLHDHLIWLMRSIVHYGHESGPGASRHLTEVAEAFRDCQAVQARTIERVGLQIQGVTLDFRGYVAVLAGEYKTLALKMLAVERLAQGHAQDYDSNPTHYENRLVADLGHQLGLDAADIRRAHLDEHAESRFSRLGKAATMTAVARFRELFDFEAFLRALVAEVTSFGPESPAECPSRLFLSWVSANLAQKHMVLDEASCTRVDIDCLFALALLEFIFLGRQCLPVQQTWHGLHLSDLFSNRDVRTEEKLPSEPQAVKEKSRADIEATSELRNEVAVNSEPPVHGSGILVVLISRLVTLTEQFVLRCADVLWLLWGLLAGLCWPKRQSLD